MPSKLASFQPQNIRNVVLIGPAGAGKTTLAESLLHHCGAITRMGSIEKETTIGDFEPEARAHHHSVTSTVLFATRQDRELNILDTPGHPDLVASALSAIRAAEAAILVVNAATPLEFTARRLFMAAGEAGLARMIVINKMDLAPRALEARVSELIAVLGPTLHCLELPTASGKGVIDCFDEEAGSPDFGSVEKVHGEILETVVEIDDHFLEQYLAGERLPVQKLRQIFLKAMVSGHLVPILFTSATEEVGIDELLHVLIEEAPSPVSGRSRRLLKGEELVEVPCVPESPFLGHVFKVAQDPYLGQLAIVRILQGRLESSTKFVFGADERPRTAGHVLKIEGRDHPELETAAWAGDIVAIPRLEGIRVDDLLREAPGDGHRLPRLDYPAPAVSLAIECAVHKDEVKLMPALGSIMAEDPTFRFRQDPSTRELVISGLGDLHLRLVIERLSTRNHLEVTTRPPAIDYRETITQRATGHHRHKKQSGGAGQFAEVFLRVEPLERGQGFQFASEVFGGVIPGPFIASVEKGARDAMESGVLAGYPVQDIRVVVTDGKTHPVDSKDIAFRTAGRKAVQDAMRRAMPVLLEPVAQLEVQASDASMGAVLADLTSRRGRILGMESISAGASVVKTQAPAGELASYAAQFRALTAGTGTFDLQYSHHEIVPRTIQDRIAAAPRDRKEAPE